MNAREKIDSLPLAPLKDLAWILSEPSFMESPLENPLMHHASNAKKRNPASHTYATMTLPPLDDNTLQWLFDLAHSPEVLANIERYRYRRIGLYFEALLKFLWTIGHRDNVSHHKLLASNVQLNNAQRTEGELDFLVSTEDETIIHVEATIKYYLLHEKSTHESRTLPLTTPWKYWVGPNSQDRLDIKLERLLTHQLPMGQSPLVKPFLEHYGQKNRDIESRALIRGILFNYWQEHDFFKVPTHTRHQLRWTKPIGSQKTADHNAINLWCHFHELPQLMAQSKLAIYLLEKMDWISGTLHHYGPPKLEKPFNKLIPKMYLLFEGSQSHTPTPSQDLYLGRLIVVEDNWPD